MEAKSRSEARKLDEEEDKGEVNTGRSDEEVEGGPFGVALSHGGGQEVAWRSGDFEGGYEVVLPRHGGDEPEETEYGEGSAGRDLDRYDGPVIDR